MFQMLDSLINKGFRFRGDRCKTLLKLVTSRIKLLRNKRVAQLKQARKELAQLLGSGQESSARIRVEHIMREQNIMEAYDVLELYCELVIVRIPIIDMQRECPLDLQEAVASLIFAAPRSSDLTELLEVRNMFVVKYGKEFVAAATELLPGCKVNRTIIEKLSVRAPSAEAKINLMREIAEEHHIDWDAESLELDLTKVPEDLLDGPTHFVSPDYLSQAPPPEEDLSSLPTLVDPSVGSSPYVMEDTSIKEDTKIKDSLQKENSLPPLIRSVTGSQMQSEEEKFIPFVDAPKGNSANVPARFYSPPRESAITQSSGLSEEALLQRIHSRTKSEGSMDLQAIVEAAEAAAESAEKAAQACRAAAEIARLKLSPKSSPRQDNDVKISSLETPNKDKLLDIKPNPSSNAESEGINHLTPDSYDWTQQQHKAHEYKDNTYNDDYNWTQHDDQQGQEHRKGKSSDDGYDWTGHDDKQVQEHRYQDFYNKPESTKDAEVPEPGREKKPFFGTYDNDFQSSHVEIRRTDSEHLDDGKFPTSSTALAKNNEESAVLYPGTIDSPPQPHRVPSLDDDYYTYPNLFTKS